MLGFQTEGAVLVVSAAVALNGAIEKVAGVELHARLGGEYFHHAAAGWIAHDGGVVHLAGGVEDEVVVVSARLLDPLAYSVRRGEIEGSFAHGRELAGWDERIVHRRVLVGVQGE